MRVPAEICAGFLGSYPELRLTATHGAGQSLLEDQRDSHLRMFPGEMEQWVGWGVVGGQQARLWGTLVHF